MLNSAESFPIDYGQARANFRKHAEDAGGALESLRHPERGPDGGEWINSLRINCDEFADFQRAIQTRESQLVADTQAALAQLDAVNRRLTGEAWDDFTRRAASSVRWIGTTDRAQPTDLPEVAEALSTGQIAARPLNGSGQLGNPVSNSSAVPVLPSNRT
jgi:hypothetical protein